MAFRKETQPKSNFTSITISLISPDKVLSMSNGEVTKPETINYRTYKPEPNGLFCERILALSKTGNVIVANTNEFVTGALSVTDAALK
jgi:DNA-directed RNA polymerase beta' subunit